MDFNRVRDDGNTTPHHTAPVAIPKIWKREELEEEHLRLLYLISKYTSSSRWLRELPLLVLIFEGVQGGVFTYDYAPDAVTVSGAIVFMNVSQEGRDDVDDLREAGLLASLKLSAHNGTTTTAIRPSPEGWGFLDRLSEPDRASIDTFYGTDDCLLAVDFDRVSRRFILSQGAAQRVSDVLTCEDVSYVCSPYLPSCVRTGYELCSDNSDRSYLAAQGSSGGGGGGYDAGAAEMSAVITVSGLHILIGEWIPFGSNQVVAMNQRLGSMDRCQGGFLTAVVDNDSESQVDMTFVQHSESLTRVQLLDFSMQGHINFEAEIHFPEDEGIVQIEHVGVSVTHGGSVTYGCHLHAVNQRTDGRDLSLDDISRVPLSLPSP